MLEPASISPHGAFVGLDDPTLSSGAFHSSESSQFTAADGAERDFYFSGTLWFKPADLNGDCHLDVVVTVRWDEKRGPDVWDRISSSEVHLLVSDGIDLMNAGVLSFPDIRVDVSVSEDRLRLNLGSGRIYIPLDEALPLAGLSYSEIARRYPPTE